MNANPHNTATSEVVTVTQAAKSFGVCPDTVRDWIKNHKLPAIILPSGQYRIKKERIQQTLQETD